MVGWHGEYDLAQGYFDCMNTNSYSTREKFVDHVNDLEKEGFIDSSTRAIIFSFTMYDIPTRFYTDINLILEISAAGFYNPATVEVRPFKIPIKDPSESSALTIYLFRWVLCIGWIILVLITMMKKGSV